MLIVTFGLRGELERQYHCGDNNLRETLLDAAQSSGLYSVAADGDELEYIKSRFSNIPIVNGHYCEWLGKMARFILMNWGG